MDRNEKNHIINEISCTTYPLHKVCTRLFKKCFNLKEEKKISNMQVEKNHYGYNFCGLYIHIDIIYITDLNPGADLVFDLSIVWRKIRFKKDIFRFYFEEKYGFENEKKNLT